MLDKISDPQSVAVVGASATPGKLGHEILKNIKEEGYQGKIYPVNPKEKEILGMACYLSMKEIDEKVDLAIVVVPAKIVLSVAEECGEAGVKGLVIISAGFKEIGGEGIEREKELIKIAEKYGMELLGPNCLGVLNPKIKLNGSFAKGMPAEGNVAVVSQSGAMLVAIMDWAANHNVGFSKLISVGNKGGAGENKWLEFLAKDSESDALVFYLESFKDGREFLELASKIDKPVVVLKAGVSEQGAEAVSSHTGSLAGSAEVVKAALKQVGVVQVDRIEDMFRAVKLLASGRKISGKKTMVVTNAGGPGVITTDLLEEYGLDLVGCSDDLKKRLREVLPEAASVDNPIDLVGDAKLDRYKATLEEVVEEDVDNILVLLTPQIMTDVNETAEYLVELQSRTDKTIMACWVGSREVKEAREKMDGAGLINFHFPNQAVRTIKNLNVGKKASWSKGKDEDGDLGEVEIGSTDQLRTIDSERLLSDAGMGVEKSIHVSGMDQATSEAERIGYPVALKTADNEVVHKADVGAVEIGLDSNEKLEEAWKRMEGKDLLKRGGLIQKMAEKGLEAVVGMKRDSDFGPVVMVGLGGTYLELFKDVAFRVAPVSREEALKMIQETKGYELMKGYRGGKEVDVEFLVDQIVKLGDFALKNKVAEIDLNPVILYEQGGKVVDCRIMVKPV